MEVPPESALLLTVEQLRKQDSVRAAARRQSRMGTSDGPQHVPQNVPVVNSRRPGSLECASALQGAALSHNSQRVRTNMRHIFDI